MSGKNLLEKPAIIMDSCNMTNKMRTRSKKRLKNDCWVHLLLHWKMISSFFITSSSTFPLLLAKSWYISCHIVQAKIYFLIYILLGSFPDNSKSFFKFLVLWRHRLWNHDSLSKSLIEKLSFNCFWPIIVKNKHVHPLNLALVAFSFNSS